MSHNGGKASQMESVGLSINEHMTSVGEEILRVLETQQSGVCCVKLNVRVFVLERLSAAAEFMCNLFQREMEAQKKRNKLLDAMLQPHIKLHRADFLDLLVCEEVSIGQQERSSSLVQEEPEPPQIKEEQQELLQRPEEAAGSTFTLLAVKSEDDDENGETEPLASTSHQHMKAQAVVEDFGTSQPTSDDQPLASHCSDSDITEDSDDWEETGADQSALNTLQSHKTQHVEEQRLSLSNQLSQDLTSTKQTPTTSSHTEKESLICAGCGRRCSHMGHLKTHMRIHTGERPFTCAICEQRFNTKSTLKKHMMTHTCTVCEERVGNLRAHMRTHTGENPFTCTVCKDSFSRKHFLRRHVATHAEFLHLPVCEEEVPPEQQERNSSLVREEPQPPQIKEEPEKLLQIPEETPESTLTLLAVKHEDDDANGETEPLTNTSTEHMKAQADAEDCGTSHPISDDLPLSSHCSESDITEDRNDWKETKGDQSALNTLKSRKRQNVEEQRLSFSDKLSQGLASSKQTPSTMSNTGKKSVNCTECGKGFGKTSHLKRHMRIHTREKPFTCAVCAKGFTQMSHLKSHVRSHTGEKPFACTVCAKCFTQMCDLNRHMRIHTGEKPFACTVCAKGFGDTGNLKQHMMTHTGEKPFTCTECGKGFGKANHLKEHMMIHTREKPFTCAVCAKGFSQMCQLNRHMRIHTGEKPFACTVCAKGFGDIGNLKQHMMTHTGEKPFTCTVCAKGFNHMFGLKRHMMIHTGEKSSTCTVCAKDFTRMGHLKRHMRIHTADDKKQQQASSDGAAVKKKSRTSTPELQGAHSDEVHSLLGVKAVNKSKKKGAGRPKGFKSKEKPYQGNRSSNPAETVDSTETGAAQMKC